MTSEWVGVIGTSIGAGIGGVVTVTSLWVKGRQDDAARRESAAQEDRHRAEDRAWSLKERDVEERRSIYADLLDKAREISQNLGALAKHGQASDAEGRQLFDWGREVTQTTLDDFRKRIARASLRAIDREPLQRADEFFAEATRLYIEIARNRSEPIEGIVALIQLSTDLEAACRQDLGLSGE